MCVRIIVLSYQPLGRLSAPEKSMTVLSRRSSTQGCVHGAAWQCMVSEGEICNQHFETFSSLFPRYRLPIAPLIPSLQPQLQPEPPPRPPLAHHRFSSPSHKYTRSWHSPLAQKPEQIGTHLGNHLTHDYACTIYIEVPGKHFIPLVVRTSCSRTQQRSRRTSHHQTTPNLKPSP